MWQTSICPKFQSVKWAGYGERANTWQKASDFSDPTIVQKYWDKYEELKKIEHERADKLIIKNARKASNNMTVADVQRESGEQKKRARPSERKLSRSIKNERRGTRSS